MKSSILLLSSVLIMEKMSFAFALDPILGLLFTHKINIVDKEPSFVEF